MKKKRISDTVPLPSVYTILLASIIIAGMGFIGGCKEERPAYSQGYFEADLVYIAAPVSGQLQILDVTKGTSVDLKQKLFSLDQNPESIQAKQAQAVLEQQQALLEDSTKGSRPDQLNALEASVKQAQAAEEKSKLEMERLSKIREEKMVSENDYDKARLQHKSDQAAVAQALANLAEAKLGARQDQIAANRKAVNAQQLTLASANWQVEQKTQHAPIAGMIYDTFYREGEWVNAGQPILAILPPTHLKVRFFAREELAAKLTMGQIVYCGNTYAGSWDEATINYISPDPEFTPPVIFSRDTNSKLVYRVEALPADANVATMHPGQPVQVFTEEPAFPPGKK